MKASQYRKIAEHPLRHLFRSMVTDPRDLPTRTALREAIAEAVPEADAKIKERLFEEAIKLAKKAATEGRDSWFDLRGEADRYVLKVVEGMEAAELIVPVPEEEVIDLDATVQDVEDYTTIGGKATRDFIASIPESAQDWD